MSTAANTLATLRRIVGDAGTIAPLHLQRGLAARGGATGGSSASAATGTWGTGRQAASGTPSIQEQWSTSEIGDPRCDGRSPDLIIAPACEEEVCEVVRLRWVETIR